MHGSLDSMNELVADNHDVVGVLVGGEQVGCVVVGFRNENVKENAAVDTDTKPNSIPHWPRPKFVKATEINWIRKVVH